MISARKEARRQHLLNAAYELFLEKGIFSTTISEIAERAQVAKGTFYLYFTDKDDIFHALVERICARVVTEAAHAVREKNCPEFSQRVILFADWIVEYFRRSPAVLHLLDRHFSWPRLEQQLVAAKDPVVQQILEDVRGSTAMQGRTEEEMWQLLFVLTEMVGATCYSSIIDGRPAPIDAMKPVMYGIIRRALDAPPPAAAPPSR